MERQILVNIVLVVGIALLYLILRRQPQRDNGFDKLYTDVLTSDKYKVKGRND